MTDQQTSGGAAPSGGAPGGEPAGTSSSFTAQRVAQMQERARAEPGYSGNPERSPGAEPAADARAPTQTPPPAEQKIKVGDAEYEMADVQSAIAERAEAQIRKQGLPKAETDYQVRNSENFKLPDGISFEFDQADATLQAAKKFALDRGLDQQTFSGMLDLFVASKTKELTAQAQARQRNLDALGAAGPARIRAVSTWLQATAGPDGAAVANFIEQYPSAPIVKAVETLIRRFTNSGIDFSQQHRAAPEEPGKIPGYENMSFAQKRAYQMQQRAATEPGYSTGRTPSSGYGQPPTRRR